MILSELNAYIGSQDWKIRMVGDNSGMLSFEEHQSVQKRDKVELKIRKNNVGAKISVENNIANLILYLR